LRTEIEFRITLISALGRITMGSISDRIGRKKTLMINLCLQIFSWLWIMVTTQSWMILLFAAAFGFSCGGITAVFPAIIGDYFGRFRAASIVGAIFTIAGSAAAIGPLVGGYIYDLAPGPWIPRPLPPHLFSKC